MEGVREGEKSVMNDISDIKSQLGSQSSGSSTIKTASEGDFNEFMRQRDNNTKK